MERYRRATADAAAPSHFLMDGGVLFVPHSDDRAFLNVLAIDIVKGRSRHVVERRTPGFKMFFDLDAHVDGEDERDWISVLEIVRTETCACFEDVEDASMIVCRAPVRELEPGRFKHGFHVHFPGIVTSSHVALAIRARCIEALEASKPNMLANGWDAAMDAVVFGGSGIRLPWMQKGRAAHPLAVYRPWIEIKDGIRSECPENAHKSVAMVRKYLIACSVRCGPAYSPTPLSSGVHALDIQALDEVDDSGTAVHALFGGKRVSVSKYDDVLDEIEGSLPPEFAGQKILAILEADTCFLLRSSSRYCTNVGRCHATSNVYFVLRPGGMYQKCYCRKSTVEGRRTGLMCKDFSGEMWSVPQTVTAAFFSDKFLDEKPIIDHPDAGVEATKRIIEKQANEAAESRRRRVLPTVASKESMTVLGMFSRKKPKKCR